MGSYVFLQGVRADIVKHLRLGRAISVVCAISNLCIFLFSLFIFYNTRCTTYIFVETAQTALVFILFASIFIMIAFMKSATFYRLEQAKEQLQGSEYKEPLYGGSVILLPQNVQSLGVLFFIGLEFVSVVGAILVLLNQVIQCIPVTLSIYHLIQYLFFKFSLATHMISPDFEVKPSRFAWAEHFSNRPGSGDFSYAYGIR
jgi:hypothetical protein